MIDRHRRRLTDYLGHIQAAVARIDRYTDGMEEAAFAGDEMTQDAVIRNLEIVGEASRQIVRHYPEFAAAHPELPLASAYQMRNAVAHAYFMVDLGIVWRTIRTDLPQLHAQLRQALDRLDQDCPPSFVDTDPPAQERPP